MMREYDEETDVIVDRAVLRGVLDYLRRQWMPPDVKQAYDSLEDDLRDDDN